MELPKEIKNKRDAMAIADMRRRSDALAFTHASGPAGALAAAAHIGYTDGFDAGWKLAKQEKPSFNEAVQSEGK